MKTRFLLLLMAFSSSLMAQPSFRPLIDSSAACNPSHGHFFIVEEMPSPIRPLDETAKRLTQNVQFTDKDREADKQIYVQCLVNCKGEAGDYQLTKCPDDLLDVGSQSIDILRNDGIKWNPGKQRGRTVDVFIIFEISVRKGKFEIIGPVY
jgi:hypothetical protein